MKIKNKLLPLFGLTSLTVIASPIIASCSQTIEQTHIWMSPKGKKRVRADGDKIGVYLFVLDSDTYTENDIKISTTGENKDSLAIVGIDINHSVLSVQVKCVNSSIQNEVDFGLYFSTSTWSHTIDGLTLVFKTNIGGIEISGRQDPRLNQEFEYTAKVVDTEGYELTGEGVDWKINPTTLASIVSTTANKLVIKPTAVGELTITATSKTEPSLSKDYVVEIKKPDPTSIKIEGKKSGIWNTYDPITYSATVLPVGATSEVTWSISNDILGPYSAECTYASIESTDTSHAKLTLKPNMFDATTTFYIKAVTVDQNLSSEPYSITVDTELTNCDMSGDETTRANNSDPYQYHISSVAPSGAKIDSVTWTCEGLSEEGTTYTFEQVTETGKNYNYVKFTPKDYQGSAKITAVVKSNGYSKTLVKNITVKPPHTTGLTVTGPKDNWMWSEGDKEPLQASATYSPAGAKPTSITYKAVTTSGSYNFTVDSKTGAITPQSAGDKTSLEATAKDDDGTEFTSEQLKLTVKQAPTDVKVTSASTEPIHIGDSITINSQTIGASSDAGGSITFSISADDSKYVSIKTNSDGTATLKAIKKPDDDHKIKVYATWKDTYARHNDVVSTEPLGITIIYPSATAITIEGSDSISVGKKSIYRAVTDPELTSDTIKWAVTTQPSTRTQDAVIGTDGELWVKDGSSGSVGITAYVGDSIETATLKSEEKSIAITVSWETVFKLSDDRTTVIDWVDDISQDKIHAYCVNGQLTFPSDSSITSIAADSFKDGKLDLYSSTDFNRICIPANITNIGNNAFQNNITIKQVDITGQATIGETAFTGCSELKVLNAINTVKVGKSAFKGVGLTTINLGSIYNQVIDEEAFAENTNTTISLKANPQTIGNYAFQDSTYLVWTNVDNVSNIETIGEYAFTGCKIVPSGSVFTPNTTLMNATIKEGAFYGCIFTKIKLLEASSTSMYSKWESQIFSNCAKLASIDLTDWTTGVPSAVSSLSQLFNLAGEDVTSPVWIHAKKSETFTEEMITAISDWLKDQINDETIWAKWTATQPE